MHLKSTIALLAVVTTLGGGIALATSGRFTDQPSFSPWYANAVERLTFKGILTGYPDGTFRPDGAVNRAELAVILDRFASAIGSPLQPEAIACTMEYRYGLSITLRDPMGVPITDATFEVTSPENPDFVSDISAGEAGEYMGLGEGKGHYHLTISKEGYHTHKETVVLSHDKCHVISQMRTIIMTPNTLNQ